MSDKSKIAALILSKAKPSSEESGESPDDESAEMSAAEELIAAVKDGDKQGVVEAFKALYDTCGGE